MWLLWYCMDFRYYCGNNVSNESLYNFYDLTLLFKFSYVNLLYIVQFFVFRLKS